MRVRTKVSLAGLREWFKMADILDGGRYDSELEGIWKLQNVVTSVTAVPVCHDAP